MTRPRLGDLLASAGRLSTAQLDEALARQKETGRRLGESLIELGHVSEEVVAQTLSEQLSVPWVSLSRVEFSRELLNLVPAELASKWMLVPVYVRRKRASGGGPGGQTLFVAIDDPLNERALGEVAAHVGMSVKPMVASSGELRSVIRIYYGVEMPALVRNVLRQASLPPIDVLIDFEGEPEPSVPAVEVSAANKSGAVADAAALKAAPLPKNLDELPEPAPARKKARMLTLTLLDGTTVSLPTATKGPSSPPAERLTTRDLILALDARAQGKNLDSVLGGAGWESLFATLLSLLLRKGLIADWEFVEEWERHPHRPAP